MSLFTPAWRPVTIYLMNIENMHSDAYITYMAIYPDGTAQNKRVNVKYMNNSSVYSDRPQIVKAELLDKVYIGWIKSDVRLIFLVTLSDRTVDIIQEKEGNSRSIQLLSKGVIVENGTDNFTEKNENIPKNSDEIISESTEEDINLPVEVLPNLYSLDVSNVSLKRCRSYRNGKLSLDYVSLKCRVNFRLNGRKEGKRYIIFTGYDEKDGVVEIRGTTEKYHFTEAGYEFVEICFNGYDKHPIAKISVSVKEV